MVHENFGFFIERLGVWVWAGRFIPFDISFFLVHATELAFNIRWVAICTSTTVCPTHFEVCRLSGLGKDGFRFTSVALGISIRL